jgi:pilus assembly protein CpaB
VATAGLPVGSFVQADGLRWQEWPDVAVPGSFLLRGRNDEASIVGAVVRRPIEAGQPISADSVVKPGERG